MSAIQARPAAAAAATMTLPLAGRLGSLLPALLTAMDWQRSERVLRSALTENGPLTVAGLAQALRRLGFEVAVGERVPERWEAGADAALVRVAADGDAEALVRRAGVTRRVTPEGEVTGAADSRLAARHYLLVTEAAGAAVRQPDPTVAWTPSLRRVTTLAYLQSFVLNLLGLSVPIFSMEIYDRVIGGNAPEVLPWFVLGTGVALGFMLVLRRQRSRLLAGAHARFGYQLSLAVIDRLLRLPLLVAGKLRRASVVSRVRELERVRDRFAYANTVAVFDAPFIVLSLLAVAFVGGWLVLVPVVYLLVFLGIARWISEFVVAGSRQAGPAITEREAMLSDLAEQAPALLGTRAATGWRHRFLEVSAAAVRGGYVQGARLGLAQSAAYVLGTGAALATLVVGLELILAGAMSPGGLIASMLLIWRITAPAQAVFLAFGRLRQIEAARSQVERFFATPYDGADAAAGGKAPADLAPRSLTFERVSFRYASDQEPALAGVSFKLEPGEMLAVVGPNGAGKTTLLRLAAGLLEPQGGLVLIGERNLRQFDPQDLRLVVGYYPEHPATFSATLGDNLRAAAPGADDEALRGAVRGAWPEGLGDHLPDGLDTRLPIPESQGIAEADDQRMGLARVLLKPAPLLIVSDPFESAGPEAPAQIRAFLEQGKAFLQAMRGRSTIVLATQNKELIALADKALVLDKGQAVHFGPLSQPGQGASVTNPGSPS
jgi:ABC-type bacteriocin/lantibiotic exporter with double-glycine peptidase domain